MLELFIGGFAAVLTVKVLALILLGTVVGIIFGSIPGLTATMAVALCIPLTFGMDIIPAISLLSGVCRRNIRGVAFGNSDQYPWNAFFRRTCFDGSPMAKRGEGGKHWEQASCFVFWRNF